MQVASLDSTHSLRVSGVTCGNCVHHVEKALRATPGVTAAKVDLKREIATVRYTPGVARSALVAAIKEAGYGVKDAAADATPAPAAESSKWRLWNR